MTDWEQLKDIFTRIPPRGFVHMQHGPPRLQNEEILFRRQEQFE